MSRRLILFDLGGVLADLGRPASQMRLAITDKEFWSLWLSSPAVRAFELGQIDAAEFLPKLAEELAISEGPAQFRERFSRWHLDLFPNVVGMLQKLREQNTLALLSNTNTFHWQMVNRQADLGSLFHHVFLSFEMGCCKPDDVIFERVLESVSVNAPEILYLDDSEQNVAAARRFGIPAARVHGAEAVRGCLRREQIEPFG